MARQVALITGGSRGIGAACVAALSQGGYQTVFLYRSDDAAAKRVAEANHAEAIRCDVGDPVAVSQTLSDILTRYRRVDVLINNAAISVTGLFTDVDEAAWRRIFSVNVDGAYRVTRAVLPGMISRRSGSIVNISSMWGQVGASCEVAYSATKAALIGMTRALAQEVGISGVRVNCICPGVIDTDMNAHLTADDLSALADQTPLGRLGTPMDVALTARFLCGEEAAFITGQTIGVNGGFVV